MTEPKARPQAGHKTRAAEFYRPECKRCKHVGKNKYHIDTVRSNLQGKNPISCTACGAKVGYIWQPVK